MNTILYQIHLDEPVLVTALEGDPNSAVSHAFIPGSVLRGVMIGAYMRQHKIKELDAGDPAIQQLFFNGQTLFLNGYPECGASRSLPVPRAWFRSKGQEKDKIFDFTNFSPAPNEQWKAETSPFFTLQDSEIYSFSPDQRLSVHNQRNRDMGRPLQEDGAVYRYIALLPGQTFQAAILCLDEVVAAEIRPLVAGQVKLGGSRTGGYGQATLKQLPLDTAWEEVTELIEERAEAFIVTLLSDALVRDEHGQFSAAPEAIAAEVSRGLGGCPVVFKSERGIPKAFIDTRLTGGFNRKWGLPLPQSLAVKMGSVFIFERPDCAQEKIDEFSRSGIGERREDGFGRLVIDWPNTLERRQVLEKLPKKSEAPVDIAEESAGRQLAGEMLQRMVEKQFEAAITRRSFVLAGRIKRPNRSQLSRLIEILQAAMKETSETGRTKLDAYLESLKSRRATRDQFAQDIVDGKNLLDWIHQRVHDQKTIWTELIHDEDLPRIGGVTFEKTDQQAYHYNLRLVVAALGYAAKAKKE